MSAVLDQTVSKPEFLSGRAVAMRYGVSAATIFRWAEEGSIPKPVRIRTCVRWRVSALEAWEESGFTAKSRRTG